MKKRIMSVVAVAAFSAGLLAPVVASAGITEFLECLQRGCAGKCTYSGDCHLIER